MKLRLGQVWSVVTYMQREGCRLLTVDSTWGAEKACIRIPLLLVSDPLEFQKRI